MVGWLISVCTGSLSIRMLITEQYSSFFVVFFVFFSIVMYVIVNRIILSDWSYSNDWQSLKLSIFFPIEEKKASILIFRDRY